MTLPVIAKVPDVIAATETDPKVLTVKLFVPLASAVLAVIDPPPEVDLLWIVNGSVKLYGVV